MYRQGATDDLLSCWGNELLRFPSAVKHDPEIDRWLRAQRDDLRHSSKRGRTNASVRPDVRELMHDGAPTACVGGAAFAYVNAYQDHVNVYFFFGALLADPARLLKALASAVAT